MPLGLFQSLGFGDDVFWQMHLSLEARVLSSSGYYIYHNTVTSTSAPHIPSSELSSEQQVPFSLLRIGTVRRESQGFSDAVLPIYYHCLIIFENLSWWGFNYNPPKKVSTSFLTWDHRSRNNPHHFQAVSVITDTITMQAAPEDSLASKTTRAWRRRNGQVS